MLDGARRGAELEADGGARTAAADPSARGETAAQSFNDAYDDIPAGRAQSTAAGHRGAARHASRARDVARLIARRRADDHRRADPQRERSCKDLITQLQHDDGGVRRRESRNLRASIRELRADAARTPTRAFAVAQRRVPAHARVRARDPARRPRDAGHDRRRVPVDRARRAPLLARPSSAAWPRELAPASARPRQR